MQDTEDKRMREAIWEDLTDEDLQFDMRLTDSNSTTKNTSQKENMVSQKTTSSNLIDWVVALGIVLGILICIDFTFYRAYYTFEFLLWFSDIFLSADRRI